ncbi:hypothetical protein VP1G_09129 [Cytospora mali]|uniref:Uncharacterized protein n=1 Tax=Cytospora mali TaxID=578113 RepID=A0A194VDZ9_CYTMA|nr:hypothetical protein VP1G_09129 [Valsa mali var. pyri (nom. inval.)]
MLLRGVFTEQTPRSSAAHIQRSRYPALLASIHAWYFIYIAMRCDSEIDRYLEEHRLDGGAMAVEVEDPENLPESFIQRLRDRAHQTSDIDQSRPVDPGQLTSRLLDISSDRDTSPRHPPRQFDRESSDETSSRIPTEELEKRDYNDLVEERGWPLYPIDFIDEVAKDPFSHWDMLRPWVDYPADSDPDPDPDWYGYAGWDDSWHEVRAAYNRFVAEFRRRSPTYTEAVKKLLAEYSFTRPFQFHEDPTQQDKLTTWIEYLGYECWVHYRFASRVERMQPKYDAAWKTLVDSSVLRPFETEEYVCSIQSAVRRQSERDQATRAVTSARSAVKAVLTSVYNDINNSRGSRLTPAARLQMVAAAKSRFEAAEEALASIARRNDLITVFMRAVGSYLTAKRETKCHTIRVQWALEQVPLIEAEESGRDGARGIKRRFGHDEDDEATHDRMIKKQRRDADKLGQVPGRKHGPSSQRAKPKRSRDDAAGDGPPFKRFKRGGEDLGCRSKASDGVEAGSSGDSHESGSAEIGSPDGDERAAGATAHAVKDIFEAEDVHWLAA